MKHSSVVKTLLLVFLLGHFNTEVNGWIMMMMIPSPSSSRKTTSVHSNEQAISISSAQTRWTASLNRQKSNSFQRLGPLWASTSEETEADVLASIAKLRVSEIKQELEALKVDYTDCFDKESMVARLLEARNSKNDEDSGGDSEVESTSASSSVDGGSSDDTEELEDEEAVLEKIRSMRVKELREELGRRRIPRAGLFDKEDLVQALWKAKKMEAVFSATGKILPGCVADLSGDQVEQEIQHTATPLLLDVYATWCGPCQMIAPLLEQAAQESFSGGGGGGGGGDASKPLVRVVKMDSDANPQMASKLKVAGLPTLVLFQHGEEIDRLEGAPMKDQLVEWVTSKLQ